MKYYRDTIESFEKLKPNSELVQNYMNKINTVNIGDIIIDIDLFRTIRWSCTDYCIDTCCDGGGICTPLNSKKMSEYLPMAFKYLSEESIDKIKNGEMNCKKYKLSTVNNRCILYYQENGYGRCAIHKVALENQLPIYAVKSFDCLIEPLEIIQLDNSKLFLTLSTDKTVNISRWKCVLPCIDNQMKTTPFAYKSLKNVFIYLFGSEFYDKFANIVEKDMQ